MACFAASEGAQRPKLWIREANARIPDGPPSISAGNQGFWLPALSGFVRAFVLLGLIKGHRELTSIGWIAGADAIGCSDDVAVWRFSALDCALSVLLNLLSFALWEKYASMKQKDQLPVEFYACS